MTVDDDSLITLEDFRNLAAAAAGLITFSFFTVLLLLMLIGTSFCLDSDDRLCDLRGSADAEDDLELNLTE